MNLLTQTKILEPHKTTFKQETQFTKSNNLFKMDFVEVK